MKREVVAEGLGVGAALEDQVQADIAFAFPFPVDRVGLVDRHVVRRAVIVRWAAVEEWVVVRGGGVDAAAAVVAVVVGVSAADTDDAEPEPPRRPAGVIVVGALVCGRKGCDCPPGETT